MFPPKGMGTWQNLRISFVYRWSQSKGNFFVENKQRPRQYGVYMEITEKGVIFCTMVGIMEEIKMKGNIHHMIGQCK